MPTTPTTPTSCASTSTPTGDRLRRRRVPPPRDVHALFDELGIDRRTRRPRATAASTCTCGSCPAGTRSRSEQRPSRSLVSSRAGIRRLITDAWWKEERGERDLHRLQPERAAQDRLRRLVRSRPRRVRRCRRRSPGVELDTIDPDAQTIATVPARVAELGDPWAAMPAEPQSTRSAARAARARPRERPPGRAVAARVPEDARRAAPGRSEPRPQACPRRSMTARDGA